MLNITGENIGKELHFLVHSPKTVSLREFQKDKGKT